MRHPDLDGQRPLRANDRRRQIELWPPDALLWLALLLLFGIGKSICILGMAQPTANCVWPPPIELPKRTHDGH